MAFSILLPPPHDNAAPPVLYWLLGLTCNDENFTTKASVQHIAAKLDIVPVMPDISLRGEQVVNDDGYGLGQGAGFYLNAAQQPRVTHLRMYDYLRGELPVLIQLQFNVSDRCAISGHFIDGHGASIMALKDLGRCTSVSVPVPIVSPCRVPWDERAFSAYLGEDKIQWAEWGSYVLMLVSKPAGAISTLADQGGSDQFLTGQLQPTVLAETARQTTWPTALRIQPDCEHSYYFVASFIEDHLRFHAQYLLK